MRALVLAIALISGNAAAAEQLQFDLVCEGRQKLTPLAPWKPVTIRMRIDLEKKVWCADTCTFLLPIAAVDAGRITLSKSDPAVRGAVVMRTVDRVTGEYNGLWSGEREEATCTPASFSGMPTAKF